MDHQRHLGLFDPRKSKDTVSIVGLGGIGSFTAVCLAKLGIHAVHIFDKDLVEPHNIPVQLLPLNSVGNTKVETVGLLMQIFAGMKPVKAEEWDGKTPNYPICVMHNKWVEEDTELYGSVIAAVDSIESRVKIKEAWLTSPTTNILIDPRLGGEAFQVITVGKEIDQYTWYEERFLPDDSDVPDLPCTAAAIIDVGFSVAGFVTNVLRKKLRGKEVHRVYAYDAVNNRVEVLCK